MRVPQTTATVKFNHKNRVKWGNGHVKAVSTVSYR